MKHPVSPKHRLHETARQMGERIAEAAQARGCCTDDDLLCAGFSAAEIQAHGEAARSHARTLMGGDALSAAA